MTQTTIITDVAISDTIMNERTFGWDTAFPSTWAVNGFFLRTDEKKMYQNTGTESVPVFTLVLKGGAVTLDEQGETRSVKTGTNQVTTSVDAHLSSTYVTRVSKTITTDVDNEHVFICGSCISLNEVSSHTLFIKIDRGGTNIAPESSNAPAASEVGMESTFGEELVPTAGAQTYDLKVRTSNTDLRTNAYFIAGVAYKVV